jgi:hypothetical protein
MKINFNKIAAVLAFIIGAMAVFAGGTGFARKTS